MTAPIFFNQEQARLHLLRCGSVYTLRRRRKTEGIAPARVGSWYKFDDLGLVSITRIPVPKLSDEILSAFLHLSGFSSIEQWRSAAAADVDSIYFVELVPDDGADAL